jgi:hypothetical protein
MSALSQALFGRREAIQMWPRRYRTAMKAAVVLGASPPFAPAANALHDLSFDSALDRAARSEEAYVASRVFERR